MENRRSFLKKAGAASLLTMIPAVDLLAGQNQEIKKVTILHTNDQHSRIEPFEVSTNERLSNKGGFARRANLLQSIRQQEKNVLLLDAGDAFQGTPYFNMFGGELEFKLMSKLGYDVMTLGNHEFDNGLEGLKKQFPHKNFPIVNANYDFTNTIMDGLVKPYEIFWRDGIKIGVFGLGVHLKGLVGDNAFGETKFLNPIEIAQDYSRILNEDEKCDLVICLSHLGYEYSDPETPSDILLARKTSGINLIIGGHTHTFLEKPESLLNKDGKMVLVNQVGYAGLFLGRIDFYFQYGKVVQTKSFALNDYAVDETWA